MSDDVELDPQEIANEARKKFSLEDRLKNRPQRTKTVTVYTDEPLAEKVGGARKVLDRGIDTGQKERWGLVGKIDALEEIISTYESVAANEHATDSQKEQAASGIKSSKKDLAKLRKELSPLIEEMKKTSLVFHLRAVPPIIIKDCRRKARKHLDIKNKNIPDTLAESYDNEFQARVIASSVERYVDTESGETIHEFDTSDARALADFLPPFEYVRLDAAISELQFRNVIDEEATADADF